jgi:hypothetical protein
MPALCRMTRPAALGGHREGKGEDMTAILAITATPHLLRAVVRDPVVRLCIQLDYRRRPGARCLIDGRPVPVLDPPRGATDALHLVAKLIRGRSITVAVVAHHLADDQPGHAELIDDALLVKVDDGLAFGPTHAAIDAARQDWPEVPHIGCFGGEPDIEAMMDRQARSLLLQPDDDRVERMLSDPRSYFARARERARLEIEEEIARKARQVHLQ